MSPEEAQQLADEWNEDLEVGFHALCVAKLLCIHFIAVYGSLRFGEQEVRSLT